MKRHGLGKQTCGMGAPGVGFGRLAVGSVSCLLWRDDRLCQMVFSGKGVMLSDSGERHPVLERARLQ